MIEEIKNILLMMMTIMKVGIIKGTALNKGKEVWSPPKIETLERRTA